MFHRNLISVEYISYYSEVLKLLLKKQCFSVKFSKRTPIHFLKMNGCSFVKLTKEHYHSFVHLHILVGVTYLLPRNGLFSINYNVNHDWLFNSAVPCKTAFYALHNVVFNLSARLKFTRHIYIANTMIIPDNIATIIPITVPFIAPLA